jgi:dihydroxyacetone kinase-like protein
MKPDLQRALIVGVVESVRAHADELTTLDMAIGDGDHGLNLRRGFDAVLAQLDTLAVASLPELCRAVGSTLIMKVGGASGPLYGSLFTALGKALPPEPTLADLGQAFSAGIAAVKRIGRSDVGQKTMLDVLAPALEELLAGGPDPCPRVKRRAAAAADDTVPMRATKGRASFLGERSVGHMDPGARSSSLIIAAVCETLEG